jgi:4-amino-4-deoxy-L-arabinose transferase-like glycosyltransferase
MSAIIVTGVILIHIAAILYTIFIIKEWKYRRAAAGVTRFITAAVIFDVAATSCMMIGTTENYFTLHGILGYTALAIMATDAFLIWRHRSKNGHEVPFSKALHSMSLFGYFLWLTAFGTGEYVAIINMQH